MSAFSVQNQARFTRLFKRYGSDGSSTDLQITQTVGSVIDLVDQTRTGGTPTTTNLVGMVARFENETFDGERVHPDDVLVDIDSAIVPDMSDIFTVSGRKYTVVNIREVKTNNVVMGYVVHLRK